MQFPRCIVCGGPNFIRRNKSELLQRFEVEGVIREVDLGVQALGRGESGSSGGRCIRSVGVPEKSRGAVRGDITMDNLLDPK